MGLLLSRLNMARALPTLIYALIFVSVVGLNPLAGVLALIVGSLGPLSRHYAESIEQIDPAQVMAVRATGANQIQAPVNSGLYPEPVRVQCP